MRIATGRLIFFDKIAEGLQSFWTPEFPKRICLSLEHQGQKVPIADLRSLAEAVCRLHEPAMDIVPRLTWSDSSWNLTEVAAVIDAEGQRLGEVIARLEGLQSEPPILVVINFQDDGTDFPKVSYDPRSQSDIVSGALEALFSMRKISVPALARARFDTSGFQCLETDFNLFDPPTKPNWQDSRELELFYNRLSRSWTYRGSPIPASDIRTWVSQFAEAGFDDQAHQILVYLLQYGFVTETAIAEGIFGLYSKLKDASGAVPISVSIQNPGKSEQKLAYLLRPFVLLTSLTEAVKNRKKDYPTENVDFFCFDDCVASGESLEKYLFNKKHNPLASELIQMFQNTRTRLNVITYHADQRGVDFIENHENAHGSVKVHAVRLLDKTHRAFSCSSRILRDENRRKAFKDFCLDIGNYLSPGHPLGFEDGQWCVAYDYSIPDNSLPILYGSGSKKRPWRPLFERVR